MFVVVVISGCGKDDDNAKQKENQASSGNVSEEKGSEEGVLGGMMDEFSKIKDGESMKCIYTIKMGEDEFQSETYVEGEKFKSISVIDSTETAKTYMIFDGEDQYSWAEGQTEGFKMSKECADEIGGESEEVDDSDLADAVDVAEVDDIFENAVDVKCEPIEDIDFSIPEGINFIDQCEMLRKQMEQIEELGGAVPEGFSVPIEVQEYESGN
jgi:hypothetical protein